MFFIRNIKLKTAAQPPQQSTHYFPLSTSVFRSPRRISSGPGSMTSRPLTSKNDPGRFSSVIEATALANPRPRHTKETQTHASKRLGYPFDADRANQSLK